MKEGMLLVRGLFSVMRSTKSEGGTRVLPTLGSRKKTRTAKSSRSYGNWKNGRGRGEVQKESRPTH